MRQLLSVFPRERCNTNTIYRISLTNRCQSVQGTFNRVPHGEPLVCSLNNISKHPAPIVWCVVIGVRLSRFIPYDLLSMLSPVVYGFLEVTWIFAESPDMILCFCASGINKPL